MKENMPILFVTPNGEPKLGVSFMKDGEWCIRVGADNMEYRMADVKVIKANVSQDDVFIFEDSQGIPHSGTVKPYKGQHRVFASQHMHYKFPTIKVLSWQLKQPASPSILSNGRASVVKPLQNLVDATFKSRPGATLTDAERAVVMAEVKRIEESRKPKPKLSPEAEAHYQATLKIVNKRPIAL